MYQLSQESEEENINAQKYIKKKKVTIKRCNQSYVFGDQLPKKNDKPQSNPNPNVNKIQPQLQIQMTKSIKLPSYPDIKDMQILSKIFEKQAINHRIKESPIKGIPFEQNSPIKVQREQIYKKPVQQNTELQKIQRQQAQLKKEHIIAGEKINKMSNQFQVLASEVKLQRQNSSQWREDLSRHLCEMVESSINQKLTGYNRQSIKQQKDIKNLLVNLLQQNIKTEKRLQKMESKMNDIVEGLNFLLKKPQQ